MGHAATDNVSALTSEHDTDGGDQSPIDWNASDWEAHLRAVLSKAVPGLCVLDMREETILSYSLGNFALVERDLRCALAPSWARRLEESIRAEMLDALAVRRELINYKKLCLHVWQAGSTVEKDLRQLTSFFFVTAKDETSEKTELDRYLRYVEFSSAMNECRGVVKAIWDARHFGKIIAAMPRHPNTGVPKSLETLPNSLDVWRPLEQARQFLRSHRELDAYWADRWGEAKVGTKRESTGPDAEVRGATASTGPKAAKPEKVKMPWQSDRVFVPSPLVDDVLAWLRETIATAVPDLPAQAAHYVELVYVARGVVKALVVRRALKKYIGALAEVAADTDHALTSLQQLQAETGPSESSRRAGLHLHAERHGRALQGVNAVVPEMLRWLRPIAEHTANEERLFVSGSRGAAAFVPRGFPDFLKPYREVVRANRGAMLAEVATIGWPNSARPSPGDEVHLHRCCKCDERYTQLWVHRGLCFSCENAQRSEGRCPFSERCGSRTFCPHERKCVVCEQWSCDKCRLLRGDGEDVWQAVGQLQPAVIFLDFDRMLATTKNGASPLVGGHSVDLDLAAVCAEYGHVQIVTGSWRKDDIEIFLKERGVHVDAVHCLKLEGLKSKSQVILKELEVLTNGGLGLFVDDDSMELTDPALAAAVAEGRLHRFLFARSGGKE